MGMDLDLYVDDESIESLYLSRRFKDEIVFDSYLGFNFFLTSEEISIITPNVLGEITIGEKKPFKPKDKSRILDKISNGLVGGGSLNNVDKIFEEFLVTSEKVEDRERDPVMLKSVLLKVEQTLKLKSDDLPLVHSIYSEKDCNDEISTVMVKGVKSYIEGDLFYEKNYDRIRNKIQVKSYADDFGKVNFLIDVASKVIIDGIEYYTKSITKAQQFEGDFKLCYDFLDTAINQNKKVFWEFG